MTTPYRSPGERAPDPAAALERQRKRTSAARVRAIMATLAVVLPAMLGALFVRQIHRLDALVDHGVRAEATATRVQPDNATTYAYTYLGGVHTSSTLYAKAPFPPGATFPVRVLPEDPSFSRPGKDGEVAAAEAASNRRRAPLFLGGFFVFFALFAALAHRDVRRIERDTPPRVPPSPRTLGRVVASVLLAVVLGVNLDPAVQAVHTKALGGTWLGLAPTLVVSAIEVVLFLPFFVVLEHLVRLLGRQRGAPPVGVIGLTLLLLRIDAPYRRSRNVVLVGLGYFFLLVFGWIVFAAAKGI
ncbi:MAG: hypothetical protein IPK71_16335 [Myxococcales bacterium]|nr:hypothetical protein [Myxococcales bacterium]